MGEQTKKIDQQIQIDKAAVQRLLDVAKILREVTSQEDIDRIKKTVCLSDDRIQFDKRRVPPSPVACHLNPTLQNNESGIS